MPRSGRTLRLTVSSCFNCCSESSYWSRRCGSFEDGWKCSSIASSLAGYSSTGLTREAANTCGNVRFSTRRFSSTYDTPEGELYNAKRDLDVLQKMALVPGGEEDLLSRALSGYVAGRTPATHPRSTPPGFQG